MTTNPPHLRHEHHHKLEKEVDHHHHKKYSSSYQFQQNFNTNLSTNNLRPINFTDFDIEEIQNWSTSEIPPLPDIFLNGTGGIEENATLTNRTDPGVNVIALYSIVIPIMLFFCVLGVIVNLVIVISARWCRKPMSPTLYFSISLALADAYASFVLGTGLIINSYLPKIHDIKLSPCLSLTVEGFRLGGILVIVTHLLALAINHWIGIIRPLHYAATMTRRTAWGIILGSWTFPITLIFLYFSCINNVGYRSANCTSWSFLQKGTFRILFSLYLFIPLIIMTIIYVHIFFLVRNHNFQRQRLQNNNQLKRNVKAIVTTVLILGTYILGWMPAILWSIFVCNDCVVNIQNVPLSIVYTAGIGVNVLIILKALVDPIIYAARMADIKVALRNMRFDIFGKLCGDCSAPSTNRRDQLERGSSRFDRSLNETKSLRMSSFGSASSTRKALAINSNSPPVNSRRRINSGSPCRGTNRFLNGNGNGNQNHIKLELQDMEMTELNQK